MITRVTTDKYGRLQLSPLPIDSTTTRAQKRTITIHPEDQRQEMLGFGAAFTDASCYLFSRLSDEVRAKLFDELFSTNGLALSVCRTTVAQSDYGRVCYSYDDTPGDVALDHFSIDYDREYIIPMIRQARTVNPDLFLFSSPWSPPGWMKTSGTMCGGWMRQEYLEVYARYYVRYLQEYAKAGITINALTTQNEPETGQEALMPACLWHPDYELAFVRDHLAPLLREHGLAVKIWLNDHNFAHWVRAKYLLDDSQVRALADGVAFHPYSGKPEMLSRLQEAHPGTKMFWTEDGPSGGRPVETEWCYWGKRMTAAMRHGICSVTGWNFALDETGKPNVGPFNCRGLVTINSTTLEITRSAQYYIFAHLSPYVQRRAICLGTSSEETEVYHIAFRNPDGRLVLFLTNPGRARTVHVVCDKQQLKLPLTHDSITTLIWPEE